VSVRRRFAGRRAAGRARLAGFIPALLLLAACTGASPGDRASTPLPTEQPSASPAVQATLAQVDGALGAAGIVRESTRTTIRPAEPPAFAGIARWPFRAVLPEDPTGGYFLIYEFADPALAADGGHDLADYITSGPGRVQYAPDVRFVLQQVGSTLVFYPWSPASSPDPKTPSVATALASVGLEVAIPRG
jgi:hypothetical protein